MAVEPPAEALGRIPELGVLIFPIRDQRRNDRAVYSEASTRRRTMSSSRSRSMWILVLVLVLVSCGGDPTPTQAPAPTEAPTATEAPAPTEAPVASVTTLEDVKSAVIQIVAQGSFVEPGVGLQVNVAGSGSGFIIDESGLAVTNNHVVTGAAFLKVWVGGESQSRNAKVLAASECSDLAVIDIDGEGFPYLEWYEGPISAGLDIYVAGFPLSDPEYTLVRGIVAKERADGETSWASVDTVIQHDASTNPGNSGGPIVTKDGNVVAIHYASTAGVNQYFAIARDEALKVIDRLRAGQDVNSIGVNGTAVNDGEGLSGIWVSSVESGSPADRAGIRGGDIIYRLEGLILATDGTMSDYCDILRSHNPGDVLSVDVLRFETGERLEGQLNGRELEAVSVPVVPTRAVVEGEPASLSYSGYVLITDDYGILEVEVPREWNDVDGSAWVIEGTEIGASLLASTDLVGFNDSYDTPGLFFGASNVLVAEYDPNSFLDALNFADACVLDGRYEYDDGYYVGYYDLYTDCGDALSSIVNIAAEPEDGSFLVWVVSQLLSDADVEALSQIIETFQVVGDLP
jgi:serine protease Do